MTMNLSTREKTLIGVLAVLLVVLGLYFGVRAIGGRMEQLEDDIRQQSALLKRAEAIQAELSKQQPARNPTRKAPVSLIGYVEQLSTKINLKGRVQLNLVERRLGQGIQGLDLKADELTVDEIVSLVYTLENADNPLVIDQMELTPSFRTKDLLRVNMRVLAKE